MKMIQLGIRGFMSLVIFTILTMASISETQAQAEKPKALKKVDLLIIGGGTGGTWEAIANGIAELVRTKIPGYSANATTGGGVANVTRVAKGAAELALSDVPSVVDGQKGAKPFEQKITNVRTLLAIYDAPVQFLINPKTGLNSIEDIKKKQYPIKVSVWLRGSTVEQINRRLLEAHGITYEDIKKWGGSVYFTDATESDNLFRDGHINAISYQSTVPATLFVELSKFADVKFLPASEEAISKLRKEYGYVRRAIPAGTYKGQNKDIPAVATVIVVIAREDVPEKVVYNVTKVIVENINYLGSTQPALKDLPVKYMVGDLEGTMHPGAQKYFKEIGALK